MISHQLWAHFISGVPTYKKTWRKPYSENLSFWVLFALASASSLAAVILQNKNIIYPLYLLCFDAGMSALIIIQRLRLQAREAFDVKAIQSE